MQTLGHIFCIDGRQSTKLQTPWTYFSLVEIFSSYLYSSTRTIHLSVYACFSLSIFAVLLVLKLMCTFITIFYFSCTYSFKHRFQCSMFDCVYYPHIHMTVAEKRICLPHNMAILPRRISAPHIHSVVRNKCSSVEDPLLHLVNHSKFILCTFWALNMVCAIGKICNLFRREFGFCIILQRLKIAFHQYTTIQFCAIFQELQRKWPRSRENEKERKVLVTFLSFLLF